MTTLRNDANSRPRRFVDESPQDEKRRLRKVAIATIVGTTVEWYDFYLYATMASIVFGTIFFPNVDSQLATLSAFATFAVGFIARPIGGIVFGHLAPWSQEGAGDHLRADGHIHLLHRSPSYLLNDRYLGTHLAGHIACIPRYGSRCRVRLCSREFI